MIDKLIIDLNKKYPNTDIFFISRETDIQLVIKSGDFVCRIENLYSANSIFTIDRNTVKAEELKIVKDELSKKINNVNLDDLRFCINLVVPFTGKIVNYTFNSKDFVLDELYNQLDFYSKSNNDIKLIFDVLRDFFAF